MIDDPTSQLHTKRGPLDIKPQMVFNFDLSKWFFEVKYSTQLQRDVHLNTAGNADSIAVSYAEKVAITYLIKLYTISRRAGG